MSNGVEHNRVVYDSDQVNSKNCPLCGRRRTACVCRAPARGAPKPAAAKPSSGNPPPRDGVIRVLRDKKQRRGKEVTVIDGVPGNPAAVDALAGELKRLCGSGGTVKGDVIEVQGDHRERIVAYLAKAGLTAKLAGG